MPMMFYALSSLHLISVINRHSTTLCYKVNWDKPRKHPPLPLRCKYISFLYNPPQWIQAIFVFTKGFIIVFYLISAMYLMNPAVWVILAESSQSLHCKVVFTLVVPYK